MAAWRVPPAAGILRRGNLKRQPRHDIEANMAEYSFLQVSVADGVGTITVNRPDKLNALNATTVGELDLAFHALAAEPAVRGIILTGAGEKAFIAGADIAELATMTPLTGIAVSRAGQDAFRFLETQRKPVLAAVNGFALGGGLEVALACHLRVCSSNARFGLPEVKLGIIPGYGGTVRLPRIVGRGRALELILTGDMIDAQEAYRIGLVNRVVEPGALRDEALTLMKKIIANGPVALGLALESVEHAGNTSIPDGLRLESDLFGLLAGTADMREGMAAFLEKRAARFEGR
jgi:enoyl-CoA hydratase